MLFMYPLFNELKQLMVGFFSKKCAVANRDVQINIENLFSKLEIQDAFMLTRKPRRNKSVNMYICLDA
ncbi:hypothetical protein CF597_11860 [Pseudomonas sp. PSB1]|nr:hypothetical protein [Pseudomonas sp. PSB1]